MAPVAAALPLFVLVTVAVLQSGRLRTTFVVFGGLLTLQSSQSVTLPKLAYFTIALLCLAAAVTRVKDWRAFRPHLGRVPSLSPWLLGVLVLAMIVGGFRGTPFSDAARDAAPYLLVFAAPLLALDAARHLRHRELERLLVVAGVLTSLAFMLLWMRNHHIASTGLEQTVLPSFFLAAALFTYATARALTTSGSRTIWIVIAGVVAALLLVTGTRSALALAVAPAAMALVPGVASGRLVLRVIVFTVVCLVVAFLSAQAASYLTGADLQRTTERFNTIASVFSAPRRDQSFVDREAQFQSAVTAFKEAPATGVGLGYRFESVRPNGQRKTDFNIDSALAIPAKLGIAGSVVLMAFLLALTTTSLRRVRLGGPDTTEALALWGFAVITVVWLFLSSPFEDKGFGFGLLLLLALTASAQTQDSTTRK